MQNPYFTERLTADRREQLFAEVHRRRLVKAGQSRSSVWARLLGTRRRSPGWPIKALRHRLGPPRTATATGALALKAPAQGQK
jgi:hypothetical protein